jgi:cytochrome c peroxidase
MKRPLIAGTVGVLVVFSSSCRAGDDRTAAQPVAAPVAEQGSFPDWALGLFGPPLETPPATDAATAAQVALGRTLYHETLLSRDRKVSCSSCHPLDSWGTTNHPPSTGTATRTSRLDIPTVYNAAAEVDLFWDGRAHDVEAQARESIKSPLEMAMPDEAAVVARFKESAKYQAAFQAAFPSEADPVTFGNVARALAAFERRLVTPSRWDQFLRGKRDAISAEEKQGFATFVEKGCSDCHNGVAVGGRMFQVAGEVKPWPLQSDSGRYSTTRKTEDLFVFRVPQLRNIEKTGPYFDTGVINDLSEAVRLMARYQRGMNLSEKDVEGIVAWLKTLTGEVPNLDRGPGTPVAANR